MAASMNRTAPAGKRGKSMMDGVEVDDDMRNFLFEIETSAKRILKTHNKKVLAEAAKAKVEARKHREAWPEATSPDRPVSPSASATMGSQWQGGTWQTLEPQALENTGFSRPASRYTDMAMSTSKIATVKVPFSLERAADAASRANLPPLAASAPAGLSLAQSMQLRDTAASLANSRLGYTASAGMPSPAPQSRGLVSSRSATGLSTRQSEYPPASAESAAAEARTRKRLEMLQQSPLAVSDTLKKELAMSASRRLKHPAPTPIALPQSAPGTAASGTADPSQISAHLKSLGVLSSEGHTHTHTHGSDHAIERRMCKACWSHAEKSTGVESGLRALASSASKVFEAQGPTNWASTDLRTKYRDEHTRMQAYEACQQAIAEADYLQREQGIIVPVVLIEQHSIHRGIFLQIDRENDLSLRRSRQRNAARIFSLDVRSVWLSGEVPAPGGVRGKAQAALAGRRDVAAIAAGHHQVQSVSLMRAMADAVATGTRPASAPSSRRVSQIVSAIDISAASSAVPEVSTAPLPFVVSLPWFKHGVQVPATPRMHLGGLVQRDAGPYFLVSISMQMQAIHVSHGQLAPGQHKVDMHLMAMVMRVYQPHTAEPTELIVPREEFAAYLIQLMDREQRRAAETDVSAATISSLHAFRQQSQIFTGALIPLTVTIDNDGNLARAITAMPVLPLEPSLHEPLLRNIRMVVVSVPYRMPARGSLARDSVLRMQAGSDSQDAHLPVVDEGGYHGPLRSVSAFDNSQVVAGEEIMSVSLDKFVANPTAYPSYLSVYPNAAAEAAHFVQSREFKQPEPPASLPTYERKQLEEAERSLASHNAAVLRKTLLPHISESSPHLPLCLQIAGPHLLNKVPGVSRIGQYITSAAIYVRDPEISCVEAITVTFVHALDAPLTTSRVSAIDTTAVRPSAPPEKTMRDATPFTNPPSAPNAVVSVLDDRAPQPLVLLTDAADLIVDALTTVKGHRRHEPELDPETFHRVWQLMTMIQPNPHLSTQPFGITMGSAKSNVSSVWPQRYTWHSEVQVRHGHDNTNREFYYVLLRKFDQGPNDPNTFIARLLHEKVRRLESTSLSKYLATEDEKARFAAEQKAKEELAQKIEAGRQARAKKQADEARLALQWRQNNIRRAARLRGKTVVLGLSHADWAAKRRKPGAKVIARYSGWERWVIMVNPAAVQQEELEEGSKLEASDVYSEVWYFQPETGESSWDPPAEWPEETWDVDENPAEDEYDEEGNTVRKARPGDENFPRTVGDGALTVSNTTGGLVSGPAPPDERLLAMRDNFLVDVLERAVRRWAIAVAIHGLPDDEASAVAAKALIPKPVAPTEDGDTERAVDPSVAELKKAEQNDIADEEDTDDESRIIGLGSGLDSRGNGLFDLRIAFEYLDSDADGTVTVRDWSKVSTSKSGLDVNGRPVLPVDRMIAGDTPDGALPPLLMHMIWPYFVDIVERTCPKVLRPLMHEVLPSVAMTVEDMECSPLPQPADARASSALGSTRSRGTSTGRPMTAMTAGTDPLSTVGRDNYWANLLAVRPTERRPVVITAQSLFSDAIVGFATDVHDVYHQIDSLMSPNVRLAFFRRLQGPASGTGFKYPEFVQYVSQARFEDDWFGWSPIYPMLPIKPWDDYLERLGVSKTVGSWAKLRDPATAAVFYKSTITGTTVWEKATDQLNAERKLRRMLVVRFDEEVACEQSIQRRQRRQALKLKRAEEERKAQEDADRAAMERMRKRQEAKMGGKLDTSSRPGSTAGSDSQALVTTNETPSTIDGLVDALAQNPQFIAALAAKLGLVIPDKKPDAAHAAPAPLLPAPAPAAAPAAGTRAGGARAAGSAAGAAETPVPATPAKSALKVPKLDFRANGLPTGVRSRAVSFHGTPREAGLPPAAADGAGAAPSASPLEPGHALVPVADGPAAGPKDVGGVLRPSEELRRNAQLPTTGNFPGIGWRQLRAPKITNLNVRAKNTQVMGSFKDAANIPNNASIIGLVDPAQAVPYPLEYPGAPRTGWLVTELTKDTEERAKMEAELAAEQGTTVGGAATTSRSRAPDTSRSGMSDRSRPRAGTVSAGGATGRAVPGISAVTAAVEGPGASAAVLAALGEGGRVLTEEERMAQLRYKAFLMVKNNRFEELEILLDEGVPINSKDENGNTLLIVAAQNGLKRIAKLLLRRGAGMNEVNLRGNTALHYAIAYKFTELSDYLLQKGCDDSVVNAAGLTCYEGLDTDDVEKL